MKCQGKSTEGLGCECLITRVETHLFHNFICVSPGCNHSIGLHAVPHNAFAMSNAVSSHSSSAYTSPTSSPLPTGRLVSRYRTQLLDRPND